jgi:hypothetical protein
MMPGILERRKLAETMKAVCKFFRKFDEKYEIVAFNAAKKTWFPATVHHHGSWWW